MDSIKTESVKKYIVCRGCLSIDRICFVSINLENLFYKLIGIEPEETQIVLCWECVALLKKIQLFQTKIQQAQFILQQSLYGVDETSLTSLSSLSTYQADDCDYTFVHEEDDKTKIEDDDIKVLVTQSLEFSEQKIYDVIDVKQEQIDEITYTRNDDVISDDVVSDDVVSVHEYLVMKEESVESHLEIEEPVEKKQSIRKYENKATVIKLHVDEDDLKKRSTRVYLSEKEIAQLLDRGLVGVASGKTRYECSVCTKPFRRSIDLKRHETFEHMIHIFPTNCLECNASIKKLGDLVKHWKRHNAYYKCDLCGWLTPSMSSMTKHHGRVHTNMYSCNSCSVTCRTLREFSSHYKEDHERIICDDCGKSFLKKNTLVVHIKRHHTPATCQECNKTYAHYHVLENHYRMYHPEMIQADNRTELAYCVECDKQYETVYKYRRHLATAAKHRPPKPERVPCPACGKVFARKIRMTNHYRSVHINTTKHRCDICNKSFCSAFSVRTHRQHVHEKIPTPKNKMCDICGRGFSTNRILSNHRRTHTGERPFKCLYCPATFAQHTAMKTHEKSQHKRPSSNAPPWGTPNTLETVNS